MRTILILGGKEEDAIILNNVPLRDVTLIGDTGVEGVRARQVGVQGARLDVHEGMAPSREDLDLLARILPSEAIIGVGARGDAAAYVVLAALLRPCTRGKLVVSDATRAYEVPYVGSFGRLASYCLGRYLKRGFGKRGKRVLRRLGLNQQEDRLTIARLLRC